MVSRPLPLFIYIYEVDKNPNSFVMSFQTRQSKNYIQRYELFAMDKIYFANYKSGLFVKVLIKSDKSHFLTS